MKTFHFLLRSRGKAHKSGWRSFPSANSCSYRVLWAVTLKTHLPLQGKGTALGSLYTHRIINLKMFHRHGAGFLSFICCQHRKAKGSGQFLWFIFCPGVLKNSWIFWFWSQLAVRQIIVKYRWSDKLQSLPVSVLLLVSAPSVTGLGAFCAFLGTDLSSLLCRILLGLWRLLDLSSKACCWVVLHSFVENYLFYQLQALGRKNNCSFSFPVQ